MELGSGFWVCFSVLVGVVFEKLSLNTLSFFGTLIRAKLIGLLNKHHWSLLNI